MERHGGFLIRDHRVRLFAAKCRNRELQVYEKIAILMINILICKRV